jgi:hypothetical protein
MLIPWKLNEILKKIIFEWLKIKGGQIKEYRGRKDRDKNFSLIILEVNRKLRRKRYC